MSGGPFFIGAPMEKTSYPPLSPLTTGIAGRCPRCGRGRLFAGYLKVAEKCGSCGLSFAFADSGDGASWFVMLFVSVVGVGAMLGIEVAYAPPYWVHGLIAIPLLLGLPLALLRPVKGVLLAQQWRTGARPGELER
jgi:uncharacterized protein (DUF983 family)